VRQGYAKFLPGPSTNNVKFRSWESFVQTGQKINIFLVLADF